MSVLRFKHIPADVIQAEREPYIYECQGEAEEVVTDFVEEEMERFDGQYASVLAAYRLGQPIAGGYDHAKAFGFAD